MRTRKLAYENQADGYHAVTTHGNFIRTVQNREALSQGLSTRIDELSIIWRSPLPAADTTAKIVPHTKLSPTDKAVVARRPRPGSREYPPTAIPSTAARISRPPGIIGACHAAACSAATVRSPTTQNLTARIDARSSQTCSRSLYYECAPRGIPFMGL